MRSESPNLTRILRPTIANSSSTSSTSAGNSATTGRLRRWLCRQSGAPLISACLRVHTAQLTRTGHRSILDETLKDFQFLVLDVDPPMLRSTLFTAMLNAISAFG